MMDFRYWQAWGYAFFSPHLYQDVAKQWRGFGLSYAVKLLLIITIPIAILTHFSFAKLVRTEILPMIEQMPTININQGKLSIDETSPFIISDPLTLQPVVMIDTSGEYKVLTAAKTAMLVTSDGILLHESDGGVQRINFSGLEHWRLDSHEAKNMAEEWHYSFGIVAYVYFFLRALLGIVLTTGLLVAGAMLYFRLSNIAIDRKSLSRLAIVAQTPALLLNVVLAMVMTVSVTSHYFLVYLPLSIAFFVFGLYSSKS